MALQDAASGKPVLHQHRFYVCMSHRESHSNHDIDARCAGYAQPINSEVSKKICELVQQGVTFVKTVESYLRFFVRDVLFSNKQCPPSTCRDFYPTKADIKNHIQKALRKDRFSSLDQENVAVYLEQMNEKAPGTRCFFRAYHVKSLENDPDGQKEPQAELLDCDALETVAQECEQTLLLCIQTEFMKELMLKYSDVVVCLDATYKTTDYALPLFLIVVKTSSCYAVAGAFIVQFETALCIEEALNIFKAWNPTLSPKFWMVDYSQAEISALSAAFPNSRPVLCDFHREQAWHRWLSKKENEVQDVDDVNKMLRQVAASTNEDDLTKAIEILKESQQWKENEKLQAYLSSKWLSVKEMWVNKYRLDLPFGTNNGTESKKQGAQGILGWKQWSP